MRASEHGFSLVELLISMLVTLIVTGAVFGLLAGGQSGFRREPEVTDRQQNIRVAMALIQRDVAIGGMDMPWQRNAYSRDDGSNNLLDGHGAAGLSGNTDWLEITGNDGLCPVLNACKGDTGSSVTTYEILPACYALPQLVLLIGPRNDGPGAVPECSNPNKCDDPACVASTDTASVIQWAEQPGGGQSASCAGTDPNGHTVFPHGQSPRFNPPGGPEVCVRTMGVIQVVAYRVITDASGVPNLWRSATGFLNENGGATAGELVARGIEDLQIEYRDGLSTPNFKGSPEIVGADLNRVVREVRITLSARTLARKLQGETSNANVGTALRGQLTTTVTPRAALVALSRLDNPAANQWR